MNKYREPYNPEVHEMHGRPWSTKEMAYLCAMYEGTKKADLSLALGRTHSAILTKVSDLRKQGKYERLKELGRRRVL